MRAADLGWWRPRKWLASLGSYRRTMRAPDRRMLVCDYLPAFAAEAPKLLWVGVRRYTRAYPRILERQGAACWTTDIDPRFARWGRTGRHTTGDICRIDRAFEAGAFESGAFDAILLNGVFGFGVDDAALQATALEAMAKVLAPGGRLLIGWNTDRTADPLDLPALSRLFEPAPMGGLPARRAVAGTTHVYDLLRRRPSTPRLPDEPKAVVGV